VGDADGEVVADAVGSVGLDGGADVTGDTPVSGLAGESPLSVQPAASTRQAATATEKARDAGRGGM
jgi:hypothetical protein